MDALMTKQYSYGDACPICGHQIGVYKTARAGTEYLKRYCCCLQCRDRRTYSKQIVPVKFCRRAMSRRERG